MTELRCSACRGRMQALFLRDVEIDRCLDCGGMWFDWGELGRASHASMAVELLEGSSTRPCPRCAITLRPALLPRVIPVEHCERCRGFFLDHGEFEEFARTPRHTASRAPAQPIHTERPVHTGRPPHGERSLKSERPMAAVTLFPDDSEVAKLSIDFQCGGCGQRFPRQQGQFYRGGLCCAGCTPQVQTTERERRQANSYEADLLGLKAGYWL